MKYLFFILLLWQGCDNTILDEMVYSDDQSHVSPEFEAESRTADNSVPIISVFNCVPHSYLITFTNFDPSIQVKYAIYDLTSNAVLEQGKFVLTNQNRFTTNTTLENCTPYKVVVSARNYPGGQLYHFSDIVTVWCQGDPIC